MSRRRRLVIVAALACIPLALFGLGYGAGFRVNLTPSYPLGLWRVETLSRDVQLGDRVFICPPLTDEFRQARERGYVRRGLCPGWFSPLIKTVVAVAGQHVVIDGSIAVDGLQLAHSALRQTDGEGRALAPALSGVVPPKHLFIFSEFAGSYDSRYFGPIPTAGVLGLARPLLVLAP